MNKGRLEAFSDGVFGIIITIMVLDLQVPKGASIEALRTMLPVIPAKPENLTAQRKEKRQWRRQNMRQCPA